MSKWTNTRDIVVKYVSQLTFWLRGTTYHTTTYDMK